VEEIALITSHLSNSAKTWKFHGKGQIRWLGLKFRSLPKTVGPNKHWCSCHSQAMSSNSSSSSSIQSQGKMIVFSQQISHWQVTELLQLLSA